MNSPYAEIGRRKRTQHLNEEITPARKRKNVSSDNDSVNNSDDDDADNADPDCSAYNINHFVAKTKAELERGCPNLAADEIVEKNK